MQDTGFTLEKIAKSHDMFAHCKPANQDNKVSHDLAIHSAGNLASQRLLRSSMLRPKLAVTEPGDAYEQEADRIADHVMQMAEPAAYRSCTACEGGAEPCARCRQKTALVQRKADDGNPSRHPGERSETLLGGLGDGRPLDSTTREFFENRFNADFGDVRVHTEKQAADSARSIDALAYALGRDIVFAPGQYAPATTQGRRFIAHELAHVLQQNDGVIRRIDTGKGKGGSQPSPCAGWEQDPESFSIHVARHFVATQVNPALAGKAVSVTCETDHDCKVTFGGDLIIDVYWYKSIRRVGAGRSTDQGRQFCAYDYSCDSSGQMILSGVKCHGTPKP
jgi:hypothetical protein